MERESFSLISNEAFEKLVAVIREIRKKCPWDSTQTLESLMGYLENETREVGESLIHLKEQNDASNLCEELGDVMMILILQAVIAEEKGYFTISDVLERITKKMTFRHPAIFLPEDSELKGLSWEELKSIEKGTLHKRP